MIQINLRYDLNNGMVRSAPIIEEKEEEEKEDKKKHTHTHRHTQNILFLNNVT